MMAKRKRLVLAGLLLLAQAMPVVAMAQDESNSKTIYGLHEQVALEELGITLPAKLDTGAKSASLSATHIHVEEDDDGKFVVFDLALNDELQDELDLDADDVQHLRAPLSGHVRIKTRSENREDDDKTYTRRPEVKLTLCIGDRQAKVTVNLTDRRRFNSPLLVGSDALRELGALVDPASSMSVGSPDCGDETETEEQG